jgi:hypothetical protein
MWANTIFRPFANNVTGFAFFEYFGTGYRVTRRIIFSACLICKW